MIRDGVEWFGSGASWPITVAGGNPYPNGNGTFDDADWVRGYYEFQDCCR